MIVDKVDRCFFFLFLFEREYEKEEFNSIMIIRHLLRRTNLLFYRVTSREILQIIFVFICLSFAIIQYLCLTVFNWNDPPAPIQTRLHHHLPITLNLQPYSLCHPNEFHIENLTSHYHQMYPNPERQVCFLIEDLDGGSWWSYVSHEFAEILSHLKLLSNQSNIIYRPFPGRFIPNSRMHLKKYFLNACDMNENLPREEQNPMIILLWNINHFNGYRIHAQWDELIRHTRMRLLVFIDDLHFTSSNIFRHRQYLFENVVSEIFSTYAYLFHNYYQNISSERITWFPHSASISSIYSINQTADNRLFVSGANLIDWYPCRWRAFLLCQTRQDLIACLKHPGYGPTMKTDSSFYYGGERYASYMRQYLFGLGTCQSVQYAIAKLFEIPANGLVLVTTDDLVPVLASLNLHRNVHFLTINCSSTDSLIDEIVRLRNILPENLYDLRQKSQEIIFQQHLTKHRAQLLHVRLLAHALIASSTSAEQRTLLEPWGRGCHRS